jgi:hypothetical protein
VTLEEQDPLALVEAAFQFLVTDFGFARHDSRREHKGFEVCFAKGDLGVLVDWYPRDPLTVWLVSLVDESFPPRGQAVIRADSTLHYFDLAHLEALVGGDMTDQGRLYRPSSENAQLLARTLRTRGTSLLSGDTGQFDALQIYAKERARDLAIAYYGDEHARTLGW